MAIPRRTFVRSAVHFAGAAGLSWAVARADEDPAPGPADARQSLLADPRLAPRVSWERDSVPLPRLLAELRRQTAVRLSAQREFEAAILAVWLPGAPLRDVMDAVAAVWAAEWERTGEREFRLVAGRRQRDRLRPKDGPEREIFSTGQRFLDALSAMPAAERDALLRRLDPGSGPAPENGGVHFLDLPRSVRAEVEAGLTVCDVLGRRRGSPPLSIDLQAASVTLRVVPRDGYAVYQLGIGRSGADVSWAFNDYERRDAERERSIASGRLAVYRAEEGAPPASGATDATGSAVTLTLGLRDADLVRAAAGLRAALPAGHVVGDLRRLPSETRSLSPERMPLRVALDALGRTFAPSSWQVRRSGMLVVTHLAPPPAIERR